MRLIALVIIYCFLYFASAFYLPSTQKDFLSNLNMKLTSRMNSFNRIMKPASYLLSSSKDEGLHEEGRLDIQYKIAFLPDAHSLIDRTAFYIPLLSKFVKIKVLDMPGIISIK